MHITPSHTAPASTTLRALDASEIDLVAGGISFDDAYDDFIVGGSLLGRGAAALIAAAWTGVALTPALILNSLGAGLPGLPGLPELPGLPI